MTEAVKIGDVAPRAEFAGDGVQTAFNFIFPFFENGDIKVYVDGVLQSTGYSVSGAAATDDAGLSEGSVTFDAAPAAGAEVVVLRDIPVKRLSAFSESGEFRARVINAELSKLTAVVQQIATGLGRAIRFADSEIAAPPPFMPAKAARAGQFLGFDAEGALIAAAGASADLKPVSSYIDGMLDRDSAAAARAYLGISGFLGVDIRDEGGAGDNETDNTGPLDDALATAKTVGFKEIVFPMTTPGAAGISRYRFFSRPAAFDTGIRIRGQAWSTTELRQDYTPGAADAFLEWNNSGGGGLRDFTVWKTAGDGDGDALSITGNGTNRHNSGRFEGLRISGDVGWRRAINVDGSLHTDAGSQGIRNIYFTNIECFGGDVVLNNVVSCQFAGLYMTQGNGAALPTLKVTGAGGGGNSTSSSQQVQITNLDCGGHVVLEHCNRVSILGGSIRGDLTIAATATNVTVIMADITGTVTFNSPSGLVIDCKTGRVWGGFRPQRPLGQETETAIATAGAETWTAAQVLGGLIRRDCNGAGRTDTLPTAALLVAALPGARVGDVIKVKVINDSDAAETLTLQAGSGGSFAQVAASRIVAQNQSKELWIRLTNVGAGTEAYAAYV